jgi:hypothetical protein
MRRSLIFLILTSMSVMGMTSCGDDDNPVRPDTTPPVVTLLAPVNGQEMSVPRSLSFQAQARDDTGVTFVEFLFDDRVVGQDSTGTDDLYECTWENHQDPPVSAGQHHATARAHDAAGNRSDAVVTITITAG